MKVTVEDQSTVKKTLHIEVPRDEVMQELDEAYGELKKNVKIKGFRPGKAPLGVLKRHYRKQVNADVSGRLIQESFMAALKETELRMVGDPKIDPPALKEDTPYAYDATIEVHPDIEDIDFKGLSLKKTLYKVQDEEVETQVKMLQQRLAELKSVEADRPAGEGDYVMIDYEGFHEGRPFEPTAKTTDFTMKLGDGGIHQDFDAAVKGMNVGEERQIEISFPQEYTNKDMAGRQIVFKVKLNEIREQLLPAIDDEMAKKLGSYETLDDLKATITDNLTQGYEKRTEQEINEQIFQTLLAQNDFELPETLVQIELAAIISDAQQSLQMSNLNMEDIGITREGLEEKYLETAEKQVRRHMILGKIMDQEKLDLADEVLEAAFKDMADTYQQPVESVKTYYNQNQDKLGLFKHALLEKEAIKLIIDHSTVEEVEGQLETPDHEKSEEQGQV